MLTVVQNTTAHSHDNKKNKKVRYDRKINYSFKKIKKENIFDNIYATTTNGLVLLINHFLPKSVIIKGPIFLKISAWY